MADKWSWTRVRTAWTARTRRIRKERPWYYRAATWPIGDSNGQRWTAVVIFSALIAATVFPAVLEPPREFKVGDVVDRDIKSNRPYLVEDKISTEAKRRQAGQAVLTVYDLDDKVVPTLRGQIKQSFKLGREKSDLDPPQPFQEEFEAVLGVETPPHWWRMLVENDFSHDLETGLIGLLAGVMAQGVASSRDMLIDDQVKGVIIRRLSDGKEEMVKDVYRIPDLSTAARMIRTDSATLDVGSPDHRWYIRQVLSEMAILMLRPNLTPNLKETEDRIKEAREKVKPVFYQVQRGEMLAREGERITPQILNRLIPELQTDRDRFGWMRLAGMFVLTAALMSCLYIPLLTTNNGRPLSGRDVLFMGVVTTLTFSLVRLGLPLLTELGRSLPLLAPHSLLPAIPTAMAALLTVIFLGQGPALFVSLIASFSVAYLTDQQPEFFAMFLASSLAAARSLKRFHSRGALIKAAFVSGAVNMLMVLAIRLIQAEILDPATPIEMLAGLAGGLLAGVIVTGLSPLIEAAFGYTSEFRLLELSNLDRPVLKELLFQAPGTYHHSIVVGNMVEAAAESAGANPLLAKVAAYYHDIGKVKKPKYFVENQDGENRHEKLAPSMSALILIAHIKEGIEIARDAKVGRQIEDIIAQHHGTNLIQYFYSKAVKAKGDKENVEEDNFRYPGPKPQTKEAGLVMLADQCEAACKSLSEPTPARIQQMVQKIINKAFSDGQLSDCELTLRDLHAIAKSFYKVLTGIYHSRIQYPDSRETKKKANGDSNTQRTGQDAPQSGRDKDEDKDDLRRLGIS